jgi:hypothetical protein
MDQTLTSLLDALTAVKKLKDELGQPYRCFGTFDSECEACVEQDTIVCKLCKHLHTNPSDNWIEEFRVQP